MDVTGPTKSKPAELDEACPDTGTSQSSAGVKPSKGSEEVAAASHTPGLTFRELMVMLREGDASQKGRAARIIEERYHQALLVVLRKYKHEARLKKLVESGDFWQSLMLILLDKEKHIELDHENPLALLMCIVNNNFINKVHEVKTKKRGGNVQISRIPDDGHVPGDGPSPSQVISRKELLALVEAKQTMLSDKERELIRLRADGLQWPEIGGQLEMTGAAARMAHKRACEKLRVSIDPDSDDP